MIGDCQCNLPECPAHEGLCGADHADGLYGPDMLFVCKPCARFRDRVAGGQIPLMGNPERVARDLEMAAALDDDPRD